MDDPYPLYASLRGAPPIFWNAKDKVWIVHRFADVVAILTDKSFGVFEIGQTVVDVGRRSGKDLKTLGSLLSSFLAFVNPPDHVFQRRYLKEVLAVESGSISADTIAELAQCLLDTRAPDGSFDAAAQYADLLPAIFMAHFLGLPARMAADFAHALTDFGHVYERACSPRFYARMNELIAEQREPFQRAFEERRREPRNDRLSRMIAIADAERPTTDSTLADHAMFLIIAASENTSALIGNSIAASIEAGLDFSVLQRDAQLADAVVEETLRYEPPMQQLWRQATRNVRINDAHIGAGDSVVLLVGAANRDPAVFIDPDQFNPGRPDRRSLSFGRGAHACLGPALAALEARIALQMIAAYRPAFDPEFPRKWRKRQTLRHLANLPLRLIEG